MPAKLNLTGRKFGSLSVIEEDKAKIWSRVWKCACMECGNVVLCAQNNLLYQGTKRCVDCRRKKIREYFFKHGHACFKQISSEYIAWEAINSRCNNPNDKGYKHYGGRGITICKRWYQFKNFIADMGEKPSSKHSIERINVNSGYKPSNCCWATMMQQSRNKRNNHWIKFNGKKMVIEDWATELKAHSANINRMMKKKPFKECYVYYTTMRRKSPTKKNKPKTIKP